MTHQNLREKVFVFWGEESTVYYKSKWPTKTTKMVETFIKILKQRLKLKLEKLKKINNLNPDAPLLYPDHAKPKSRRDFLRQGLVTGTASVLGPGIMGMFSNPGEAYAALAGDISTMRNDCGITVQGAGKIPFISNRLFANTRLNFW